MGDFFYFAIIGAFFAALCWFIYDGIQAPSRLRKVYLAALEELKRQPFDPSLRDRALQAGRAYAWATVPGIFDEVMLMNDIRAACASASVEKRGGSEATKAARAASEATKAARAARGR